jgi:hypothetical protein
MDPEIADVIDLVAQLAQPLGELRDPERGRAHIHPAAAGPQVERDADHADSAHRDLRLSG